MVEAEGASEPLLPMNRSITFPFVGARDNQPIAEPLMISLSVIVGKVLAYGCPQGVFVKEDHSLQTLLFNRPHESLGESVQVRRTRRKRHGLDSRLSENSRERRGVERISILDEVSFLYQDSVFAVGHVSADLLHPKPVRTLRDSSELNAARRKFDEKENHKTLESSYRPELHLVFRSRSGDGSIPWRLRMLATVL